MKRFLALLLVLLLAFSLAACSKDDDSDVNTTVYTEDSEVGQGEKTYYLRIVAEDMDITLTVHTNETKLGKSLRQIDIVAGEESEYGLYIQTVNGVRADYDKDKAYWAIKVDGEMSMVGVDDVDIEEGKTYELAYTPA